MNPLCIKDMLKIFNTYLVSLALLSRPKRPSVNRNLAVRAIQRFILERWIQVAGQ